MRLRFQFEAVLVWLVVATAAFAFYQFRGLVRSQPFGDYLLSAALAAAVILVSVGMGLRLLGGGRISPGKIVASSAVGLAALGITTLLVCSIGLLRAYVVWPLLAVIGGLCRRQIAEAVAWLRAFRLPDLGVADLLLVAAGAAGAIVLLANCLAPLTANDALVYHLSLPKIYAESGGLARLPYNVYANMPHYGEMLYTLCFSAAGETGAKMFYFFMVIGAAVAIYALARMFVGRRFSLVAALAFIVQPLVLDQRVVCNVDILLAFFFVSAVLLVLETFGAKPDGQPAVKPPAGAPTQPAQPAARPAVRSMLAIGLVAGFMLGTKYTAVAPCLALLVLPLVAFPKRLGPKQIGIAALVAAAVFAPWLVKNELYTGNPFYPMLESTFDGANWDSTQQSQLVRWQSSMGMGKSALDYLLLPFNVSARGRPEAGYRFFDGTMSPVLLILLPLAAVRLTRRTGALAMMAVATFVFWALTSQQLRFLMPSLALGYVLAGIGLSRLAGSAGAGRTRIMLVLAALVMGLSLVVPDQYGRPFASGAIGDRLAAVLGLEGREQFLERNIQSYAVFDHINRTVPRREPIFMVWENRAYYLDNPYLADSFFEASTVMRMVQGAPDAADLGRAIQAKGFEYVLVNEWLGEYFSKSYPSGDTAKLRAFIETCLEPVHSSNKITLYKFRAN